MNWVYIQSETGQYPLWTVGFYDPDGDWQSESDHDVREDAAKRVHYLNGGIETTVSREDIEKFLVS